MDSKNRYRAEDLLSGRIPQGEEDHISDSERELADEIKIAVKSAGQEKLESLETAALWEKIAESTTLKTKRFSLIPYLKAAAVLLVAFGIGFWQYSKNTPTHKLMEFAAQNLSRKSPDQIIEVRKGKTGKVTDIYLDDDIITTNDYNTVVVGEGRRSAISLPDGTKVWLNSGSKLIYPIAFQGDTREVYLEGEGYFDVSHDKQHPFFVRAKHMEIRVLGTEFYVSSNTESDQNYAVLVQGSIAFSTGNWLNRVEKKLVPGQQISIDAKSNNVHVSQVKTTEFEAWKAGYVDMQSEPLDEIIQRIARYYHIEISTGGLDLSGERFSGRLDLQRSVADVIQTLCLGTPYTYNDRERRLELKKR
mgnify:CR=1 FL=1